MPAPTADIESYLPDLTELSLRELRLRDDELVRASLARLLDRLDRRDDRPANASRRLD